MCPDRRFIFHHVTAGQQGGFAMIMAIFIVVVLAMLGGFIVNVSSTQHAGAALDIMGSQANLAARAGIEYGLSRAKAGTCATTGNASFSVDNMTVAVTCSSIATDEAGITTRIYTITALACNVPTTGTPPTCPGDVANPNYVERSQSALAEI